ncbi:MAG: c-type cytochrome [Deltaproteobacteria bacterium]|nr:c-type cytochrome [Deltaproteobacteria bacterium]
MKQNVGCRIVSPEQRVHKRIKLPAAALLLALFMASALTGFASTALAQGADLEQIRADLAKLKKVNAQDRGRLVFRAACAPCHGVNGDGRGLRAVGFEQPPTNLTRGVYKFRSTTGATVARGDIERSIREGMPGTEMVPFKGLLDENTIGSLADYLIALSPRFDDPKALGNPNAIPARSGKSSPQSIAKGKEQFTSESDCADCHNANGSGSDDEEDEAGVHVMMVDFRDGIFKSGLTDADLFRSIKYGMPGTTMVAYEGDVSDDNIWAIVDYIRSLEDPPGFLGQIFAVRPSRFDYRDFKEQPKPVIKQPGKKEKKGKKKS